MDDLNPKSFSDMSLLISRSKSVLGRETAALDSYSLKSANILRRTLESRARSFTPNVTRIPEDEWQGTFTGFNLAQSIGRFQVEANRKCLLITDNMSLSDMMCNLFDGVRCFIVDFFLSPEKDICERIMRLKSASQQFLKQKSVEDSSTIIAKLSPRYPYTGLLQPEDSEILIKKGQIATLTWDRTFATCCRADVIYVNSAFGLSELECCDVILIGFDLQFSVDEITDEGVKGHFITSGKLRSLTPIRFHSNTLNNCRLSLEEIFDVTLAKEMNIGIIIGSMIGTPQYFKNFRESLDEYDFSNVKLFGRLVLSDLDTTDDPSKYDWIIDSYDGFYIEMNMCDINTKKGPQMLNLSNDVEALLEKIYHSHRPIILDPKYMLDQSLVVPMNSLHHFIVKPDKFVVNEALFKRNYLDTVRDLLGFDMLNCHLKQQFRFDSYTGVDALAYSIVTTAVERKARIIIINSLVPLMAIKISHFRAPCIIVLATPTESLSQHVSAYYNVLMLRVPSEHNKPYQKYVIDSFINAITFLNHEKLIKNNDKCVMVYGMRKGVKFCDKYFFYEYLSETFREDLQKFIFQK